MYSWTENANAENQRLNGIRFEDAICVFDDPFHVTTHVEALLENRTSCETTGATSGTGTLIITYEILTRGAGRHKSEVRILAARKATRKERRGFEGLSIEKSNQILGHGNGPGRRGWFGPGGPPRTVTHTA